MAGNPIRDTSHISLVQIVDDTGASTGGGGGGGPSTVTGNVASGTADSGNPVKVGGKAFSGAPAAVDAGDRVDQAMTLRGAAHFVFAREDGTLINPDAPSEVIIGQAEYESFPASATTTIGATGAVGDYLAGLHLVPSTVDAGAVQIKDGSGTAITVFAGGTGSLSNLVPFTISLGIKSKVGAWQVITNAGMTGLAIGEFT